MSYRGGMTTPWPHVLQQVQQLNDPQAPFSYSVTPEGVIVGFWDVAKIQMLGLTGASTFDKEYRVDVRPTGEGEIALEEHHTESRGSVGAGGARFEKQMFKGKSTQKSFGMQIGVGGTSHGQPTNVPAPAEGSPRPCAVSPGWPSACGRCSAPWRPGPAG